MKMKEDSGSGKTPKPGYNLQLITNGQYVIDYGLYSNPTDTRTLIPQLEEFKKQYGFYPRELTADSGYGSEENYAYLEQNNITGYVKYNYYDRELSKGNKAYKEFHQETLYYNSEGDYYVCPIGQKMYKKEVRKIKNKSGYVQELHIYEAQNCSGCPMRSLCHKGSGNRQIKVNHRLKSYRRRARELLNSEKGRYHRSRRGVDVETVFGNIKHNKGFRRFSLRGKGKCLVEIGLVLLSHNIQKYIKVS